MHALAEKVRDKKFYRQWISAEKGGRKAAEKLKKHDEFHWRRGWGLGTGVADRAGGSDDGGWRWGPGRPLSLAVGRGTPDMGRDG